MKSIDEIVQDGANVHINFHCETKKEAFERIYPFNDLGEMQDFKSDDYNCLSIEADPVNVTAFYEKEVM